MKRFFRSWIAVVLVSLLPLASCATSSHVLTGRVRPPISPGEVSVLLAAPEKFDEIAQIKGSSGVSLQSADAKWGRAVEELCKEAAKVGANAIVLEIPDDDGAGEVAASGSKPIHNGDGKPIELGAGTSTKTAPLWESLRALAIYVPD